MLTATTIKQAKAGAKRVEKPDGRGLYLVIQPGTQAKTWALRFRKASDGKHTKLVLGSVDLTGAELQGEPAIGGHLTLSAARKLASEVLRQRALGNDIKRTKPEAKEVTTFAFASLYYLTQGRAKGKRSRNTDATAQILGWRLVETPEMIKGGLASRWASRDINDIDDDALADAIEESRLYGIPGRSASNAEPSESRAREMHAALSSMFRWLAKPGRKVKLQINPAANLDKPAPAEGRERVLTDEELTRVLLAAQAMGTPWSQFIAPLVYTAARRTEVAASTWDEFNLDEGTWRVPAARMKAAKAHTVPLSPQVVAVLRTLPMVGIYAFSTDGGAKPITGYSKMKKRLDALSGITGWTLHDIWRTTATGLEKLGVPLQVTEAILGHAASKTRLVGTYQRHDYTEEKAAALCRWGNQVEALVSGKTGTNVTPMRKRRRG